MGCGERPGPEVRVVTETRLEKPAVKPEDLRCGEKPKAGPGTKQSAMARLATDIAAWGDECARKLEIVRRVLEP